MAVRGEGDGTQGAPARRRRALLAWLSLAAVVLAVIALLVLDLWVLRPPGQRAFIARNLECLRCHTELIAVFARASVHQPFAAKHCTSCHTRHGYRMVSARKDSGTPWLRARLERWGLGAAWRVVAALDPSPPAHRVASMTAKRGVGRTSVLTASEQELCWTCHGSLAPERVLAFQHPPFEEGLCTSCHDPHASSSPSLVRAGTPDVCASCHRIADELMRADVHQPFGERRCVACHEPHASSHGALLVRAQRELCFGCHPGTAAGLALPVTHEPFESGGCTRCHEPHSAAFAPLLAAPEPALCYRCHGGVRVQFTRASSHPVPTRVVCSDCHRPHAAPESGLLPVAQRQLCFGCHASVRAELTRAVVHEPFGHDRCTRCHVPHGSDASPLLAAPDPALCKRCHPGIPSRPVRSPAPFRSLKRPPDLPVVRVPPDTAKPRIGVRPAGVPDPSVRAGPRYAPSGRETSHRVSRCSACHRPHSADHRKLTTASGDTVCLRCHARDVPRIGRGRHRSLACSRCHRPHLASAAPLLAGSNPRLCLGCHAGYTRRDAHPVGARYYDYLARGPLTCTSTCHDPHGDYADMLRIRRPSGEKEDRLCLLCHTKVGLEY